MNLWIEGASYNLEVYWCLILGLDLAQNIPESSQAKFDNNLMKEFFLLKLKHLVTSQFSFQKFLKREEEDLGPI